MGFQNWRTFLDQYLAPTLVSSLAKDAAVKRVVGGGVVYPPHVYYFFLSRAGYVVIVVVDGL